MVGFDLLSIATFGFLGSFGHCLFMCGGIVCAYCTRLPPLSFASHCSYNFGRISTYMFIGGISGLFGQLFSFNATFNGVLLLLSGGVLIIFALAMLGFSFFPKLRHLLNVNHFFNNTFFQKTFHAILQKPTIRGLFTLGLLNGFLPCGMVSAAALVAASSASFLHGVVIMGVFGLSTLPALFLLGCFVGVAQFFNSSSIRKIMLFLSTCIIVFYGIFIFLQGLDYFLNPQNAGMHHH